MKLVQLIILPLFVGGSSVIRRIRLFRTILCLFIVLSPVWSRAELTESVDSEALEILKRMNDYLLSLPVVGFRAIENEEEVFDDGQKIMFSREIRFKMARPNKFHIQLHNGESELEMFYDSSSFTIFRKDLNFFATTNAPQTITEVFAKLDNKLNIQIVARDILRDDSNKFLLASIRSGFVVGDALVNGVLCTHLAFRLTDTDMQLWIAKGQQALPMKYVVTSRWITGAPQYAVTFFDWVFQGDIDNAVFVFKAPQDAKEIPFAKTTPQQEVN
jgi:hypothetical protein